MSKNSKSGLKKTGRKSDSKGQFKSDIKETNGYKLGMNPPDQVELFYDVRDSSYWYRLNGRYIAMAGKDLAMQLRGLGLRDNIYFDGQRELDWPLWRAQTERMVDYAGPLAGHRVGVFKDGSDRNYLVTEEASGIFTKEKPAQGKPARPEFFGTFIEQLLHEDQHLWFCHWLAIALRSLIAGDWRPGQVCIFAGEHGCGKSLLQLVITEIFGGRSGKPFEYMSGETGFNADFCGTEHWMIEDPRGSIDIRSRREFGARLKEGTVNRDYRIHPKGKQAIVLPLLRRITLSVNLELEYLSVCPPFDPSFSDKAFLFLCNGSSDAPLNVFSQFRSKGGELDREKIWRTVMDEVPKIRAWLLANFKLADLARSMRDDRFGIKAWHHPVLLSELSSLSYESRLLELIDQKYFGDEPPHMAIKKKSQEIQDELLNSNRFEAEKVLRHPGACGSHLSKLAKTQSRRVVKHAPINGYTYFTIFPPSQPNDKNQLVLGVTEFAMTAGTVAPAR